MRILAALVCLFLLAHNVFPHWFNSTRDEMLLYYQEHVQDKIPKTAELIIGDERINLYIDGRVFGIETRQGELYSFEAAPLGNPTIVVTVSDQAGQDIASGKSGVLSEIDSGGIKIDAKNFFSALKVEVAKRIYAVSGADDIISGRKKTANLPAPPAPPNANSILQKVWMGE